MTAAPRKYPPEPRDRVVRLPAPAGSSVRNDRHHGESLRGSSRRTGRGRQELKAAAYPSDFFPGWYGVSDIPFFGDIPISGVPGAMVPP
ncbi:hypothetical protein GCM10010517_71770 [Streptosporangium fragile]|uniref:Uncharacterized protein n=1 Tax=Streptosporangium fragile TaxID=46186 RepID=A0ABN3W8M3_9ACTN